MTTRSTRSACHCIGGIIGALLTGVFASKEISGADGSVIIQLWGRGNHV